MKKEFETKVSVATIVPQDDKILFVKELRDEKFVYNLPAGWLEPEEQIVSGATREVKEETGLEVKLDFLVGVYEYFFSETKQHVIRFCFVGQIVGGKLNSTKDEDVIEASFYSRQEIKDISDHFRNPIISECLKDYWAGKKYPLDIVNSLNQYLVLR